MINAEDMTEAQRASLFLQALCFVDATPDNRQRIASLLDTLRTACDAQVPENESIALDNQQLSVQLGGMVERILEGEPLIEPEGENILPSP